MSSYQIGAFGFVRWEGPPPQLVKQHLQRFTKPGQDGISAQAMGIYGDPFQVTLTGVFPNQSQGLIAEDAYRFLVGAPTQVVIFNGVNYFTTYSHRYLVDNVQTTEFKRHPLLSGINYAYYGGWRLQSQWTLVPIT